MDLMPDYDLERARLELEISQLELNIKAMEYRKLQLNSELAQNDVNIAATNEAIANKRTEIAGIVPKAVEN